LMALWTSSLDADTPRWAYLFEISWLMVEFSNSKNTDYKKHIKERF